MIEDSGYDEDIVEDYPTIKILFNGVGSSEYSLEIDPRITANQVWIVANYFGFIAQETHKESRMAKMIERQRQMEMEKQSRIFIPEPKLTKPS